MKKTLIIASTILTLTLSGLGYTSPTAEAAESVSENNEKISKVETKIINSSKKIDDFNLDIDVLENAIAENDREAKKVTKEVHKLEKDIKKTEKEIVVLEEEIEKRNEILKQRLSSYQNDGGEVGFMEVIFGSKGFEEFISRYTAVSTITTADNKLVETQKEAMVKVESKQKEVEKKLVKTTETKKEIEKINKIKKDQKSDLTGSKKSAQKELANLKDKKADYVAKGNDLAALEERIKAETIANNTIENVVQTATQPVTQVAQSSAQPAESVTQSSSGSTEASTSDAQAKKKEAPKVKADLGGGSNGSAISAAHSVSGNPYVTAGKGPGGFDCSGLVAWAYGQEGVSLPSYTGALAGKGSKVPSLSQAKAGDLVFFRGGSHVGIYLGGGKFIGSQSSTGVAVASMNSGYWKNEFDGHIRRVK